MTSFRAFRVEKNDDGTSHSIAEQTLDDLPAGDVLIKVSYSSLNYKDALSAKGMPGVTRSYPHTPGIDASGVVVSSDVDAFKAGDEVIVIGFWVVILLGQSEWVDMLLLRAKKKEPWCVQAPDNFDIAVRFRRHCARHPS